MSFEVFSGYTAENTTLSAVGSNDRIRKIDLIGDAMNTSPFRVLIILSFLSVAGSLNAAVLAYWDFDSFSPGTSNIGSITSTGTISGGVTLTAAAANRPSAKSDVPLNSGKSISAYFNSSEKDLLGSSDVVKSFNFAKNQAFTVEGWFKLDSIGNTQGIFSNRGGTSSGNAGLSVLVNNSGLLVFLVDDGPILTSIQTSSALTTNTWYYFAAMRTETGSMKLYLGGTNTSPSVVDSSSTGNSGALNSDLPTYIGTTANAATTSNFSGWISEIRVSDTALDSSEFLWSPIPEPDDLALSGLGAATVVWFLRRKRFATVTQ